MESEDRVLEEALARYASVEPLAGMEQRVLRRIRADRARRRFAWWAGALAAACGMLMAALWTKTAPETLRLRIVAPRPPQIAAVREPSRPAARRMLSKPREFPAPTPLTREERALLAFVAHAPDQARDFDRRTGEPIRIEEIKIEPLE